MIIDTIKFVVYINKSNNVIANILTTSIVVSNITRLKSFIKEL